MSITVDAIYEGGVLKPSTPLPLKEHEAVRITIDGETNLATERVRATAGLMGWTGGAETIERLALDPQFDQREEQ